MKPLNTMQFLVNMTKDINDLQQEIRNAETYEDAKRYANRMIGYIGCATTFLNTMLCTENNGFTEEFDDVLTEWERIIYSLMADKAIQTNQSRETIAELIRVKREMAE